MIEHANIFYMPYLNVIGGTEQFVYEIAKKYNKYDIAVIYKTGHEKQLQRLRRLVPIYQYAGQKIKCVNLFCNYATDICKNVEAENYIQVIHAMYKTNRVKPVDEPLIQRYLAVSEIAKKEYEELTGIKSHVLRYWEEIIPSLTPQKDFSGRRIYSSRDLQIIFRLKYLIQEKKFTIEGARNQLIEDAGNLAEQNNSSDLILQINEIRGELLETYLLVKKYSTKDSQ